MEVNSTDKGKITFHIRTKDDLAFFVDKYSACPTRNGLVAEMKYVFDLDDEAIESLELQKSMCRFQDLTDDWFEPLTFKNTSYRPIKSKNPIKPEQ